ncbi:hypothetical protein CEY12_06245 [Chryseobacterium sp. T16E-39]|uniref:hypothetical protein n=1 Tax=Chryseobacterium sp. T16E-39 TaxID=2015076 RepID=UPI000B5B41FB|nr:hypothetical protein [Chryseobacterium sp. T16E-39]ASK29729.1 hypothetical protein CEY12_06245 [Chryseobacterium sp. T16E-39]
MGIKQFPYTLTVFKKTEASYNEEDGSFIPGTEGWVSISKCRDEGNGGGSKIVTTDGEVYVYGAVIYLPKNCPKVSVGERIKVIDLDGNVRLEGDTMLWKKEQLHTRLWL